MKRWIWMVLVVFLAYALTGCASIVSDSQYHVQIDSEPSNADLEVRNQAGMTVYSGKTPATVMLDAGDGFFSSATYDIQVEKPGYSAANRVLTTSLDGWYFGNLLFGGLIGLLVVDPATGAMFSIDQPHMVIRLD